MAHARNKRSRKFRHPRRRGIVLLIIISLLVLFMLMLVTFAVVSGHYRDAARSSAYRRALATRDSRAELETVFVQLIADSDNTYSSLYGHGLLRDLYGDSIRGQIANTPASEVGGTFNSFNATLSPNQTFSNPGFKNLSGYYAGCVLTMIDGPCKGLSTRIVRYEPVDPTAYLQVPQPNPQPPIDYFSIANAPVAFRVETFENGQLPVVGNSFVVNGKPFNGAGFGARVDGSYHNDNFDDPDPNVTGDEQPWALMPHLARWLNSNNARTSLLAGADEPWDAFDYQNMFLTLVETDANGNVLSVLPAFHRPDLVQFWETQLNNQSTPQSILDPSNSTYPYNASLARQIIMRPIGGGGTVNNVDHPQFSAFNAVGNTWDVDNDKDGVMDSIWIDPGLPIAYTPDGRPYKRLVAIMVRDLDSRLQVNAQGNTEFAKQVDSYGTSDYARPQGLVALDRDNTNMVPDPFLAGSPSPGFNYAVRGVGYGPAEINFPNIFTNSGTPLVDYQSLLQGSLTVPGRYGFDVVPGMPNLVNNRRPGLWGLNDNVGWANNNPALLSRDLLSVLKGQGFGVRYFGGPAGTYVPSNYGSPPDVWGRGALVLDYTGQPVVYKGGAAIDGVSDYVDWMGDASQITREGVDHPYEINLYDTSSSADMPYTVAELERVISQPTNSNLPSRLLSALQNAPNRANLITTHASHIPAPRGAVPFYMRSGVGAAQTFGEPIYPPTPIDPVNGPNGPYYSTVGTDILSIARARVKAELNNMGLTPTEYDRQLIVQQLMPFEFFRGEMFNLNRPFGNGVDDDNNGIVDEPGEGNLVDDNGDGNIDEYGEVNRELAAPYGPYVSTAYTQPLNGADRNLSPVTPGPWFSPLGTPPTVPPAYAGLYANFLQIDPHLYARQMYARNVYCLLRLMCDPQFFGTYRQAGLVGPDSNPANFTDQERLYFRRLAQFAINLVDYRDSDAIMTPFEYDLNPWDGWHVDGFLATDENQNYSGTSAFKDVVWGMEQPDLLMTETKSFHNRRVRDTDDDNGGGKLVKAGDNDPDQLRIPEGSTFFELYCTRNRFGNNVKLPPELYNAAGDLDLSRMIGNRPVWQIAITQYNESDALRPQQLASSSGSVNPKPDTFAFQPHTGDTTVPLHIDTLTNTSVNLERFVWFAGVQPNTGTPLDNQTFYSSRPNADPTLSPGQYMVVGPRESTVLGSIVDSDSSDMNQEVVPSPQQILLNRPASGMTPLAILQVNDTNNGGMAGTAGVQTSESFPADIRQPKALIVDMRQPDAGASVLDGGSWDPSSQRRVGVNVTEPLPQSGFYYAQPTNGDAYDDLSNATNKTLPNVPFDSRNTSPLKITSGTKSVSMVPTGSYADRHTAVLQRLANPAQPYDAFLNPYITVDWASMDITVFAGEENTNRKVTRTSDGSMVDVDPEDPLPQNTPMQFGTRQRGSYNTGYPNGELWSPLTRQWDFASQKPRLGGTDGTGMYFTKSLAHTLGYVNSFLADDGSGMGTTRPAGLAQPLPASSVGPNYVGEPSVPFPWVTWNNRPFANPMELLTVPAVGMSEFGANFDHGNSSGNVTPYYPNQTPAPSTQYTGHFLHLQDFFSTTDANANPGGMPPGVISADLYRLFDYVETPSPYVGSEEWFRPDQFPVDNPATPAVDESQPSSGFFPPFNRLSNFRDRGRININTVTSPQVWDAITSGYLDLQSSNGMYQMLVESRRGYGMGNAFTNSPHFRFPSITMNPFRPADASHLVMPMTGKRRAPVESTLLRSQAVIAVPPTYSDPLTIAPASAQAPLFDMNGYPFTSYDPSVPQPTSYRATDRNAYFRYQPYTKLANMLSTNSNTFAVWQTIGYFEVTANPGGVDVAHPDGYQLGAEVRFDDGNVKRPRAFYIIDRSIPAAFEPGQKHNIDRCVLQRRYLDLP